MGNAVFAAVKNNDIKGVRNNLSDSNKSIIHSKNADEETCLHLAVKLSNIEMMDLLILKGGDLSNQDKTTKNTLLYDLVEKLQEMSQIWTNL